MLPFPNDNETPYAANPTYEISFINKVYGLMCLGLLLTAGLAYWTAGAVSPETIAKFMWPAIILEFVLVLLLSFLALKMPAGLAFLCFLGYAAVNGFTLSMVFLVYTKASIAGTFCVTGATFGIMNLYGTVTKRDLTTMGNLLGMALLGLIIATVVNLFLKSNTMDYVLSWLGILIFTGLTAYDSQKIKRIGESGCNGLGLAVLGALTLYLDFINLFLYILRIMGRRK